MEARKILSPLLTILVMVAALQLATAQAQFPNRGGQKKQFKSVTQNFVVFAPDAKLSQRVAKEAERFRKELSVEWLGKEIDDWREKCPIHVQIGMHAGGETSFAFITNGRGKGVPVSWQMKIFGPPDRLLDAVLPHEVTHTIFATHFGRPLPRWADEGACTTVEHETERKKNHRMLIDFLNARPSRGIAFNRMFTMRNYPHDILPLYAQGYSLAKFLIMQKGKRHFLNYIGAGMAAEVPGRELRGWDKVTKQFYGFRDLSELQLAWIGWVKNGSKEISNERLASNDSSTEHRNLAQLDHIETGGVNEKTYASARNSPVNSGSWYAVQAQRSSESRVAANRKSLENVESSVGEQSFSKWTAIDVSGVDDLSRESAKLDQIELPPPTIWR